jgi:hypothetical protein
MATENKMFGRENIQLLEAALRKHKQLRDLGAGMILDLLSMEREQTQIEKARPPRRFDTAEPPPRDYADLDAPPAGDDDEEADWQPPDPARPAPISREVIRCEIDCLGGLLRQPELLSQVNRKLRELAETNVLLLEGPLAEFGAGDFSHRDYQALMATFLAALDQDELTPLAFMEQELDEMLRGLLQNEILVDNVAHLRPHLRHGLQADLTIVQRQTGTVDIQADVVRNALRLRLQRIERERQDVYFLIMEDDPAHHDLHARIQLSIRAKSLIDAELQRQVKPIVRS